MVEAMQPTSPRMGTVFLHFTGPFRTNSLPTAAVFSCIPDQMSHKPARALIIGLVFLPAVAANAATSIQSFSPATNDRLANDPAFVGAAYDYSGVGRDATGRWLTMLSSTVFISANHYHPSGLVTFYPGNDPLAVPETSTVASAERIGVTDLYIGTLAAPLSGSIASYGFVTVPLTNANFGSSPLFEELAYMGGISPTTTGYGANKATNETVGTNLLEGFEKEAAALGGFGDLLITVNNQPGDGAYGFSLTTYEAQLASGDSGSPLFVISGGHLVLAGIALGVTTEPTDIDPGPGVAGRVLSAFGYTGGSAEKIQSYLDTGALPVPEPGALVLVFISLTAVCRRRRVRDCN